MKRIDDILKNHSVEEVNFAAEYMTKEKQDSKFSATPFEALSLYIDLDLSEYKYVLLRNFINNLHENCLPSLYALQQTKKY